MGKILIVTGMSGAGKTICLKHLEDMGYYAVDNLPVALLENFVEISVNAHKSNGNIALGVDIRGENEFGQLEELFKKWKKTKTQYSLIFLDAKDDILVKRFKESRRDHPLVNLNSNNKKISLIELIKLERKKIYWLKDEADYYIDTDGLKIGDLKNSLLKVLKQKNSLYKLNINIISFGYKYGIPNDIDLLFDIRFLPNPYYVDKLRKKTGLQKEVKEYVTKNNIYSKFEKKVYSLIDFTLPEYNKEGKNTLVIGIGCTGGHHRSVVFAQDLKEHIEKSNKYIVNIEHRDIKK
ncbi:MAG: RNase adapter RapZ [Eubacteriales bacterium]|nr:RNase adapter RapZ [Eubacteriales bacterium]